MSNEIKEMTYDEALAAFAALNDTTYRDDQVRVRCQSRYEYLHMQQLSDAALRKGHVYSYTDPGAAGDFVVLIDFRRPPVGLGMPSPVAR